MNLRRSPMKRSEKPMRRSEIPRTPMKPSKPKAAQVATRFSVDVKLTVIDRDKGMCFRCGVGLESAAGNAHHRCATGQGGSRDKRLGWPSNALLLCADCHAHVESHRTEAYEKGWLVHSGADPAKIPVLRWDGCWYRLDAYGRLVESLTGPMTSPGEGL